VREEQVPREAAGRAGVFTSSEALSQGWTARQVHHRLAVGRWRRVAGWGLTAEPAPDDAPRLAWAATVTLPDCVIAGRVAAGLWGFPLPPTGPVEVYTSGRTRSLRGIRALHGVPNRSDLCDVDGLQLTSRRRTALDCCAALPWPQTVDLYAWVTSRHILDRSDLAQAVRERFDVTGNAQLRRLLDLTRHGAVSAAEHRCHTLLRRAGITGWRAGATVRDAMGVIGVVDLLFDAARVVVEIDGERAHSSRTSFVGDRRRQNRLVNAGYLVLRFTWWDLVEHPEVVIDQIRAAVDSRHP